MNSQKKFAFGGPKNVSAFAKATADRRADGFDRLTTGRFDRVLWQFSETAGRRLTSPGLPYPVTAT